MARTALDIAKQEWEDYQPSAVSEETERSEREPAAEERRRQGWSVAHRAAHILYEHFGASRVVVFGSLVHGTWFTRWSDIDLAAWGIPSDRFYMAVAAVTGLSPLFKVDLIDPDACRSCIRVALEREGVVL